jgi:hypothetical protein
MTAKHRTFQSFVLMVKDLAKDYSGPDVAFLMTALCFLTSSWEGIWMGVITCCPCLTIVPYQKSKEKYGSQKSLGESLTSRNENYEELKRPGH